MTSYHNKPELYVGNLTSLSRSLIKECVYEDLDLKRGVHAKIDDLCKDDAIIASSASALIPSLISQNLKHKNRFIVCHPVRNHP